jgi:excisionase family DNA binding protein
MTVREVSAYLQVHPSTIYRLLARHQIPAFRIGSDWRFNIEAIDRWRLGKPTLGVL